MFNSTDTNKLYTSEPKEMTKPFTEAVVKAAITSLKNNKSPGSDNIKAEQLKYAPDSIHRHIVNIFNETAKTGVFPRELKEGILIPLQKPGKEKGKVESLRPVILVNIIRKVLAIIMMKRIIDRIDAHIPISQVAYRAGRGTTEHVFTQNFSRKSIQHWYL